MPVQTGKSGLMTKYGKKLADAAHKHADDPVDYGFMRVPPGINNGIAKLVECTFGIVAAGKQNAGEYYFRAAGVIVSPKSIVVNGVDTPVAGLQTSIMEMVCDTKTKDGKVTTMEEHVANIQNEMKKFDPSLDVRDLEKAAAALKAAGPYFRFSTSAGKASPEYPEPRTWENWYGTKGLEDYSGEVDPSAAVDDRTGGVPVDPVAEAEGLSDEEDLDGLIALAESDNDDVGQPARDRLSALAGEVGMTTEEIEGAANWSEVVERIRAGVPSENGEAEAEPAAEWAPEKGDVYQYKPIDPKTKKPYTDARTKKERKPIDVEVVAVDPKTKTMTLKSLDDGKTLYKGVAWDALESGE